MYACRCSGFMSTKRNGAWLDMTCIGDVAQGKNPCGWKQGFRQPIPTVNHNRGPRRR